MCIQAIVAVLQSDHPKVEELNASSILRSGTTAKAAAGLGRRSIGIEIQAEQVAAGGQMLLAGKLAGLRMPEFEWLSDADLQAAADAFGQAIVRCRGEQTDRVRQGPGSVCYVRYLVPAFTLKL